MSDQGDQGELRHRAIQSLNAKRGFWGFVATWVILSVLFVVIWAAGGMGDFWPVWPIAGIGVGVAFSAWGVYGPGRSGPSEDRIQDEMRRLGG